MADVDGIQMQVPTKGTEALVMMQPISSNGSENKSSQDTDHTYESFPGIDERKEDVKNPHERGKGSISLMVEPGASVYPEANSDGASEKENVLQGQKNTKKVAFKETEDRPSLLDSPRPTSNDKPEIFLQSNQVKTSTTQLPRLEDIPVKFPGQFTNRRERIIASLGKESIKTVTIPSHHITDNVVLYEVEVSNKNFIWNLWLRFDQFSKLHQQLSELAVEYTAKYSPTDRSQYHLPPFPVKQPKIIVDHKSRQFVEERRALLENFIQKVLGNEEFRHYEAFVTFLLPPKREIAVPRKPRARPSRRSKGKRSSGPNEVRSKSYKFGCRLLQLSERDEITALCVSRSNVTDVTTYQVDLSNENKPAAKANWTVFKRYGDFATFDANLRKEIAAKYPDCLKFLPPIPPKSSKLLTDHKDPVFIERRRVLLDSYCQNLIKYPVFRRHALAIEFFEVKFGP